MELESEQEARWFWHDDGGGASPDQVDHEEGEGGERGEQQLVAPAKIEHIVSKTQEDHATDRQ